MRVKEKRRKVSSQGRRCFWQLHLKGRLTHGFTTISSLKRKTIDQWIKLLFREHSIFASLRVSASPAVFADVFVILRAILWERCYSYSHQPGRELRPRAPLFVTWGRWQEFNSFLSQLSVMSLDSFPRRNGNICCHFSLVAGVPSASPTWHLDMYSDS